VEGDRGSRARPPVLAWEPHRGFVGRLKGRDGLGPAPFRKSSRWRSEGPLPAAIPGLHVLATWHTRLVAATAGIQEG